MVPLNFTAYEEEPFNLGPVQYKVHLSLTWVVILMNVALFALAVVNFWNIIIKQGKWRTMPLLTFYVFSIIAIATRILSLIDFAETTQL